MTNKQKLIVSIFVSILVLAIIGLGVAMILVASNVSIGGSMHVTYEVNGVACSISSSAQIYDGDNNAIGSRINPEPLSLNIGSFSDEDTTTYKSMEYKEEIVLYNAEEYLILTINVRNAATNGAGAKSISAEASVVDIVDNFTMSINNEEATTIPPSENRSITVTIKIDNPSYNAKFEGNIKITVSQAE